MVELIVGLKIPDTTAITTYNTLIGLGYKDIKSLKRFQFYSFNISGPVEGFDITKADILVNHNKNTALVTERYIPDGTGVIVEDYDDDTGLKESLRALGYSQVRSVKSGILWVFDAPMDTVKSATEELLYNKHYQRISYRRGK